MPDSVSVLPLVRPPLVMVVVEPASVKMALLSERARPPLVMVVIEPVSVPPIFGIWLALAVGDRSRRRRSVLDLAVRGK